MGAMGRYIASLTDEQKDRLVTATEWQPVKAGYPGGPRCMVAHAQGGVPMSRIGEAMAFDDAVARFGLPRVVRAIKLRAGAKIEDMRADRDRAVLDRGRALPRHAAGHMQDVDL